jgi:hypothetical protein
VKVIQTCGVKRSGAYVVVLQLADRYVVRWRAQGLRREKAFPRTAAGKRHAKAHALGTHEALVGRLSHLPTRLTVREVFDRYVLASEASWRPKTRVNEHNRWQAFEAVMGPAAMADLVTPDALDDARKRLLATGGVRGKGMVPNQVRAILSNVKRVWRLAVARKWLTENPLAGYKIPWSKDDKVTDVAEFRPEEAAALMQALSPKDSRRWRAHVVCRIAGTQGPRINALLNARDADFDLAARTVVWRAEHDKLGRERVQPLTIDAVAAVRIARIWRHRIGYTGAYLLPAVRHTRRKADLPLAYQGLARMLHAACAETGVEAKALRAFHGFRRMAARTVLELTGDVNAAAEWIGDTDLRTVKKSYLKERPESLVRTAALIRMPTEAAHPTSTVRQLTPKGRS